MPVRRVAWLLAVLAAACLAGALVLAWSRRPATLTAGGVVVRVPHDWEIASAGEGVGYGPVRLVRPAVYGARWCGASSRAFAGLAEGSFAQVRDAWAGAIGATPVTSGRRADAEAAVPPGTCQPPRVHLTVVDAGTRVLVLMRDVGLPADLSAAQAEDIVDSLSR